MEEYQRQHIEGNLPQDLHHSSLAMGLSLQVIQSPT
jgi:hypothetical protein